MSRRATIPRRRWHHGVLATHLDSEPGTAADDKLARDLLIRQRQSARHLMGLRALLSDRQDLLGVHAPADVLAEQLLWGA
jgi:hypothetical protein